MAYSNCCNCSGNCGSAYGTGYARRNNNSWYRNSYAALNTVPAYTRYRNYPFYTGNCPNACGCYHCGCTAGVTNQNCRHCYHNCGCINGNSGCCDNCGGCNTGDTCGCCLGNGACCDNMNGCSCGNICCDHCGCDDLCGSGGNCDGCCNHCGCDRCCGHHNHGDCPVYGLFSSGVPLTVTAGAAIPLATTSVSNHDFTVSNGAVTINCCGTYMATYTVNVPAGAEVDTTIVMNVNGIAQPSTLLNVDVAGSYTGQTVFKANAGTTVSLVSSAAFSITEPVGQNIVTLTLTRIG